MDLVKQCFGDYFTTITTALFTEDNNKANGPSPDLHMLKGARVAVANEMKDKLDHCFREEKRKMLLELNKDFQERRREEEAQAAISTGKNMTFQQYLTTDTTYMKEMEELKKKNSSSKGWFGFQAKNERFMLPEPILVN